MKMKTMGNIIACGRDAALQLAWGEWCLFLGEGAGRDFTEAYYQVCLGDIYSGRVAWWRRGKFRRIMRAAHKSLGECGATSPYTVDRVARVADVLPGVTRAQVAYLWTVTIAKGVNA